MLIKYNLIDNLLNNSHQLPAAAVSLLATAVMHYKVNINAQLEAN